MCIRDRRKILSEKIEKLQQLVEKGEGGEKTNEIDFKEEGKRIKIDGINARKLAIDVYKRQKQSNL